MHALRDQAAAEHPHAERAHRRSGRPAARCSVSGPDTVSSPPSTTSDAPVTYGAVARWTIDRATSAGVGRAAGRDDGPRGRVRVDLVGEVHRRRGVPGRDGVDGDAGRRELEGQHADERVEPRLRGAVRAAARDRRVGEDGRHGDDRRARRHVGHGRPRARPRARQVDGERLREPLEVLLGQLRPPVHARVEDQDRGPPERRHERADGGVRGGGIAQVERDRRRPAAEALDRRRHVGGALRAAVVGEPHVEARPAPGPARSRARCPTTRR